MIEILRDPAWQFVGVIFALLSFAGAFWIYWLQRQTRELAFGLVSSRRPLAISDELSSRVTVQLDGNPVRNLHLLVFGLKNSGHRAIAPSDFQYPLSISFPEGQVVSAEIASQFPLNLGGQLDISESRLQLSPLLLNSGDQMLIQVLLSASSTIFNVDVRILDISTVAPVNSRPRLPPFFQSGLPMMMGVILMLGIGILCFSEDRFMAYWYLGLAGFIPLFGLISRIVNDSGKAARRRLDERVSGG